MRRLCLLGALLVGCTTAATLGQPRTVGDSLADLERPRVSSKTPLTSGAGAPIGAISATLAGGLSGRVVGEDGRAIGGVSVAAYQANRSRFEGGGLVGNNAAGIVSSGGGLLISDVGGPVFLRVLAVAPGQSEGLSALTDDDGNFVVRPPVSGLYNLEAVLSGNKKSWKANLAFSAGQSSEVGILQLGPTGNLAGTVLSENTRVSEFTDSVVYVPGSSYGARTHANGSYVISQMPSGVFPLRAHHPDLGEAEVEGIRVVPNTTGTVPTLILRLTPPSLTKVLRVVDGRQTLEATNNGAPGSTLALEGSQFAYRRGTRFEVRFTAATADTVERVSNDLIRVKIPAGAQSGQLLVVVGGLVSNALPFNVIRAIKLRSAPIPLNVGDSIDLGSFLEVQDTNEVAIKKPNLAWSLDSGLGTVSSDGLFQGFSAGDAKVVVKAGDVPGLVLAITVLPATGEPKSSPISQSPLPASEVPTLVNSPLPTSPPAASPPPPVPPTATPASFTPSPAATPTSPPSSMTPSPVATPTASPASPTPTPLPQAKLGITGLLFQSMDCPWTNANPGCANGIRLEIFGPDHPAPANFASAYGRTPLVSLMMGNYHYFFDSTTAEWLRQWSYGNTTGTAWDTTPSDSPKACKTDYNVSPSATVSCYAMATTNGYDPRYNNVFLVDKLGSVQVHTERKDKFVITVLKDPAGVPYVLADVATASQ